MPEKHPKRPRDPNQLAKLITDIATGEAEDTALQPKDEAAATKGRKGGAARASALDPQRRREIAEKAASQRWGKPRA